MADFWTNYLLPAVIIVGQIIAILIPLLIAVAYLTLAERKVIAAMQLQKALTSLDLSGYSSHLRMG